MKCPLTYQGEVSSYQGKTYGIEKCLKEECAWWNNTNGNCAILQLSKSIYWLGLELAQAVKKMPHEGQFRK